jgi:hypothetical protein
MMFLISPILSREAILKGCAKGFLGVKGDRVAGEYAQELTVDWRIQTKARANGNDVCSDWVAYGYSQAPNIVQCSSTLLHPSSKAEARQSEHA